MNVTGIMLLTGLPGHGKTLYALQLVEGVRKAAESTTQPRPIFHNGINGLSLPWTRCKPEDWRTLPPGAIFVIDECQDCFPQRGRGEPPEWINELAKHRHLGLSFVLITQNPMLIDSFVRRLVDRHLHVMRKFGTKMATVHEFTSGVKEEVAKSRTGSIRHEWRYPAEVFSWYKSAEVHTVKRRIPMRLYVLAAIPLVLVGLAAFLYARLMPDAAAERMASPTGAASAPRADPATAGGPAPAPVDYFAQHAPRIAGLAHTAPVYDAVTAPAVAPYPAACIASQTRCSCYTQQATVLEMPETLCRDLATRGFFVSWRAVVEAAAPAAKPVAAAPAPAAARKTL